MFGRRPDTQTIATGAEAPWQVHAAHDGIPNPQRERWSSPPWCCPIRYRINTMVKSTVVSAELRYGPMDRPTSTTFVDPSQRVRGSNRPTLLRVLPLTDTGAENDTGPSGRGRPRTGQRGVDGSAPSQSWASPISGVRCIRSAVGPRHCAPADGVAPRAVRGDVPTGAGTDRPPCWDGRRPRRCSRSP